MKKLLSILVLSAIVLLPMNAKAIEGTIGGMCDKSKLCENGKCTTTCRVYADAAFKTANVSEVTLDFTFKQAGVKMVDVKGANNWIPTRDGNKVTLLSSGWGTNSNYDLMTFTLELDSSVTDCSFSILPSGFKTITITIEDEEPPKTGSALPIAIVATGAAAAGVIYLATRKNKKLYKI